MRFFFNNQTRYPSVLCVVSETPSSTEVLRNSGGFSCLRLCPSCTCFQTCARSNLTLSLSLVDDTLVGNVSIFHVALGHGIRLKTTLHRSFCDAFDEFTKTSNMWQTLGCRPASHCNTICVRKACDIYPAKLIDSDSPHDIVTHCQIELRPLNRLWHPPAMAARKPKKTLPLIDRMALLMNPQDAPHQQKHSLPHRQNGPRQPAPPPHHANVPGALG